jgi:hypothetical protein
VISEIVDDPFPGKAAVQDPIDTTNRNPVEEFNEDMKM